jgi:DNA repair exonuclease SbcCD ATPase subunit
MDEAFDSLDKNNALRLLKILYNLSNRFNQIFIVSHFTDVLYNLTNCIKLEKISNKTIIK